jgi:hypothetical protein
MVELEALEKSGEISVSNVISFVQGNEGSDPVTEREGVNQ